jgi:hypothetical protein
MESTSQRSNVSERDRQCHRFLEAEPEPKNSSNKKGGENVHSLFDGKQREHTQSRHTGALENGQLNILLAA